MVKIKPKFSNYVCFPITLGVFLSPYLKFCSFILLIKYRVSVNVAPISRRNQNRSRNQLKLIHRNTSGAVCSSVFSTSL